MSDLARLPETNTMSRADAAIFYAREGIPVFPLKAGKSVPATIHGKDAATADLDYIEYWWQYGPGFNIGLVCGVIFDALDIDIKDGRPRL